MQTHAGDLGSLEELDEFVARQGPQWWMKKVLPGDSVKMEEPGPAEVFTTAKVAATTTSKAAAPQPPASLKVKPEVKAEVTSSSSSSRVPQQTFSFMTKLHIGAGNNHMNPMQHPGTGSTTGLLGDGNT